MRWHLLCLLLLSISISTCNADGITVVKKQLDGPLEDIQWADLQTVFVITEKGTVYRSKDGGKVWSNIVEQFRHADCETIKINAMHISPVDPTHIIFTGLHQCNYITTDMGKTIAYINLDIKDVRLHPTQKKWILASTMSDGCDADGRPKKRKTCFKKLHYSKDFGTVWTLALEYVVQFDWSPPVGTPKEDHHHISDDLVYVTAHSIKSGNQKFGFWDKNIHFLSSNDYFKTSNIVVPNGNRFLFGEHSLLFVAAVSPTSQTQVTLKVSRDNVTRLDFKSAQLPVELTEHSYTILDTSEGSVFLHVNHKPFAETAYAGHVYVSDWSGTRYSLSLPYNHRNADGKCDFEKVEGIEGIYLANFIDEDMIDEEENSELGMSGGQQHGTNHGDQGKNRASKLKTKTVISYDKGGEWNYLTPPKVDSRNNKISCAGECHLHLHGITDIYGPFYTAASAIGLIMATGSIGTHLQANQDGINTYLSRDAGYTWFEVAKGSHIYEFGDHGGLIVMAEDSIKTTTVYYSWNEGKDWTPLKISDIPMQVENIIIEPEAVSQTFLIYGWEGEQGDVGVIVHLPFDELHENVCKGHETPDTPESDYETWTPSDHRLNGKCLLGHQTTYIRRKHDHACYNPEAFERPVMKEHCPCTDEDFQCDFGYERHGKLDSAECIPIPDMIPEVAQDQCATSNTYRITKGYRRVPGDTCTGGEKWEATELPCPSLVGGHIGKIILILMILVLLSLAVVTAASKFEAVDDFLTLLKQRWATFRYKPVGAADRPDTMHDEDAFYLSDPDFGPSATLIDADSTGRRSSTKGGRDHDGLSQRGGSVNTAATSNIRPLPARSAAATEKVPVLDPSPDDDFNPRGS